MIRDLTRLEFENAVAKLGAPGTAGIRQTILDTDTIQRMQIAKLIGSESWVRGAARAALVALRDWSGSTDSFCEECHKHAPKDEDGEVTGPVRHGDDCRIGNLERALAVTA